MFDPALFLHALHQRKQSLRVIQITGYIYTYDVFCFNPELYIISRFQLSVLHMVVFHPHERSAVICLGIAVPLSKDFHVFSVFCIFFQ